jgi:hypothetical protein
MSACPMSEAVVPPTDFPWQGLASFRQATGAVYDFGGGQNTFWWNTKFTAS